jgi:hypothetical protein
VIMCIRMYLKYNDSASVKVLGPMLWPLSRRCFASFHRNNYVALFLKTNALMDFSC